MRINNLTIKNFKGIDELEIVASGKNISIMGANGTGKTSVADAINWMLFGKNYADESQFGIRPVGCEHEADTVVEANIAVDDKVIRIRKTLHEKWETPKGQADKIFKGLETKCDWNEIPCKIKEFQQKVIDMLGADENVVKLCTRPEAFFKLKLDAQRALLTSIVGTPTDEEIIANNDGLSEIIKSLNGENVSELKAKLSADIKALKKESADIPARIDEISGMKKEEMTDEQKAELAEIESKIQAIVDANEAQKKAYEKAKEASKELFDKIVSNDIEVNKLDAEKRRRQAQAEEKKSKRYLSIEEKKNGIACLIAKKELSKKAVKDLNEKLDKLRADWDREDARMYDGTGLCPYCGQPLPADKEEENLANFNFHKAEELKKIEDSANAVNVLIEEAEKQIEKDSNDIKSAEKEIEALLAEKDDDVDVKDLDDKINDLNAESRKFKDKIEINKVPNNVSEDSSKQLSELTVRRDELKKIEQVKEANTDIDKRIEELHDKALTLGQKIAELQQQEFSIKKLETARINAVEERVNKHFSTLKWKMFDYTIDGNPVETCKALINGVEYNDANTASKINAGIEVINVLTDFYKINAPIVIDNRESVTNIIETQAQVINLIVSPNHKKLSIVF